MNILKLEWNKNKSRCFLITTITLCVYLLMTLVNLDKYAYNYQIELWEINGQFFDLFFPLLCMLCVGDMVYQDKKNNYIIYIGSRLKLNKYLRYKKSCCLLQAAFFVFCVSFLGFLVVEFLYPDVAQITYNTRNFEHVWQECYVNDPVIYGLLLSIWRSLLAAIIVNFGFELSKFIANKVIIMITPFIVVMLIHFVFAIFDIPQMSILYSFDPSFLTPEAISVFSMLFGPLQFLFLSFLVFVWGELYEKYFVHC